MWFREHNIWSFYLLNTPKIATLLNEKLFVQITQFGKLGQHVDKFWTKT